MLADDEHLSRPWVFPKTEAHGLCGEMLSQLRPWRRLPGEQRHPPDCPPPPAGLPSTPASPAPRRLRASLSFPIRPLISAHLLRTPLCSLGQVAHETCLSCPSLRSWCVCFWLRGLSLMSKPAGRAGGYPSGRHDHVSPGHIWAFPHPLVPPPVNLRHLVNSGTQGVGMVLFPEREEAATSLWGVKGHRPGVPVPRAPRCLCKFSLTKETAPSVGRSLGHNQPIKD